MMLLLVMGLQCSYPLHGEISYRHTTLRWGLLLEAYNSEPHILSFAGQSLVSAPRNIEIRIRTGDSSSAPRVQGFPASRNRIHQFFRSPIPSRRVLVRTGSSGAPPRPISPFSAEFTERNEAVPNAQVEQTKTVADDGIFMSNVPQQNVPSSSSVEAGSNSSSQASSREEESGERGRPEPPSPPESKRQKTERLRDY